MAKSDEFNIQLRVAGKSFPLTIRRDDEEFYRRAEREVNDLVTRYKSTFRGELEDHLAMAALQIAVQYVMLSMSRSLGDEIESLVELDEKLNGYIQDLK